jgi:succinate dehydrogenase / fumarate reductase cytochrome b subunit
MPQERPLSPHLQVYKLPLTGILSIAHRLSGLYIAIFGFITLTYWLSGVAGGAEKLHDHLKVLNNPFVVLLMFVMTFAVFYHFLNGIRHMFGDIGKGMALEQANKTAKIVLIATAVATILFWVIIA